MKDDEIARAAAIAARSAKLSPERRAALERRFRGEVARTGDAPPDLSKQKLSTPTLVTLQAGQPGRRPFFFIHAASGTVLPYLDLTRYLDPQQPFYGLQARGLDGLAEPFDQVSAMASYYLESVRRVQPEGPYWVGGWCIGGLIAFEMACQLESQGAQVTLLTIVERHAPVKLNRPEPEHSILVAGLALDLGLPLKQLLASDVDAAQLAPDEQLAYIFERVQRAGVIPSSLDLDAFRRIFEVFKGVAHAQRYYEPRAQYHGALSVFVADAPFDDWGKDLGWSAFATGPLTVHQVPGDHYSVIREPNVARLAELLNAQLRAVS